MCICLPVLATLAATSVTTLPMPDFDRWNYPFNASSGTRTVGSTFSSFSSGYDFDNRDGQLLLGWYADEVATPGLPPSAYAVTSCSVTITVASDDIAYDPTLDNPASYHPDGPDDADVGRPVVLSGVAFRNGWNGWTFGETGPFGEAMTSGTRNCFAIDFDDNGAARDISNSLTEDFVPNQFAIAQTDAVAPNEMMPAYTVMQFDVDVSNPDIACYIQTALSDGLIEFAVTSLHGASKPGGGGGGLWPDWVFKEHALVGIGLIDAAGLSIEVTVTQPSGIAGDVDGDGIVGVNDLLLILEDFGVCPCCPSDLDGSGAVTVDDLLVLIGAWGS
jgi:hypothetical protein